MLRLKNLEAGYGNLKVLRKITMHVNAGEIGTTVEVLKSTSSLLKLPAPGNVYKNLNIWVGTSGFATAKNIKDARILFRIENTWIASNRLEASDIKLLRWDGSNWITLETEEKTRDGTYTYFETKTDSFSGFAIAGMEKKELLSPEKPVILTPTKTAEPSAVQHEEKKSEIIIQLLILFGGLLGIGIIIEMYLKKKKK